MFLIRRSCHRVRVRVRVSMLCQWGVYRREGGEGQVSCDAVQLETMTRTRKQRRTLSVQRQGPPCCCERLITIYGHNDYIWTEAHLVEFGARVHRCREWGQEVSRQFP
jgi:hypothetical protein